MRLKYYKYQAIDVDTLDCLRSNTLWASNPSTFNDPFEFKAYPIVWTEELKKTKDGAQIEQIVDETKSLVVSANVSMEECKVVCYTQTRDNLLMWAHYADEHRGMCLQFEVEAENFEEVGLFPVNYQSNVPGVDENNLGDPNLLHRVLTTKSLDWRYEKELRRLVSIDENKVPYIGKLSSVIVGAQTSDEKLLLVHELIRADYESGELNFEQALLDAGSYSLGFMDMINRADLGITR